MIIFVVASFLFVLPLVKSNTCPDGTQCPGDDTCCSSNEGYKCCTIDGGNCCSDGEACCAPGTTCVPFVDTCIPFSSNGEKNKIVVTGIKSVKPKASICPTGTTDCGKGPVGEECCPLPNAVCCSGGKNCCPSGYSCDLSKGLCNKNTVYSQQHMKTLEKTVKNVLCPDGGQCPQGNTCCLMAGNKYGCCQYSNAICCIDGVHCCPGGLKCNVVKGTCELGQYSIPWMQKIPTVEAKIN